MFTVAVFQDVGWADRGIGALIDDGFDQASLSVVAVQSESAAGLLESRFGGERAVLDLKRLGPVVARGPFVAALQGDDRALETKGLADVCGRAGFQAHDGYIFETLVGRGGVLVAVQSVPRAADALAKLHAYGGGNAAIGAYLGRV